MIRNQDNTVLMMSSLYASMKTWVSVFLNCSHRKSALKPAILSHGSSDTSFNLKQCVHLCGTHVL